MSETLRPAADVVDGGSQDVAAVVVQAIADVLAIEAVVINDDHTLLQLGAQSFDFVDVILKLEQQLRISIPRSYAIPATYTVGDLTAVVREMMKAR